jgi:uncharacterized protein
MNSPTQIDFDQIDQYGPQTFSRTFDVRAEELDHSEIDSVGPLSLEVRAEKGDLPEEYIVSGTVSYVAGLRCSRCVDPFPFANLSSFHLRYRPRPEAAEREDELEITEEELDVESYDERSIPLRQLAVDQIELTLPMKPLCDESCLGLCPQCGSNLSREQCTCNTSMVDGRWDALRGIREELGKKNQ